MRPKTFPATPYAGNTRQRLQEIKEGLKQPAKLVSQALQGGRGAEGGRPPPQQHHPRAPQKFGNYQTALREIRRSLLPFANDSGSSPGPEVNRQMLQELVNAGCDQEMAVRALKQTGSRSIEAALEFISKMGYLDPRTEQIVRVIKQTSPGKGGAPSPADHRPALEGASDNMPSYHQLGAPLYETAGYGAESAGALGELPRSYMGAPVYLLPPAAQAPASLGGPVGRPLSVGPYPALPAQSSAGGAIFPPCDLKHQQKPYAAGVDQALLSYPVASAPLQVQPGPAPPAPAAPGGPPYCYPLQRSSSFQSKLQQEGYGGLQGKGPLAQAGSGYPGLYLHPRQSSPPSPQVHVAPSRASLNLDLYEHHWAGEGAARQPPPPGPYRGEVHAPSRTNSFNSPQKVSVAVRPEPPLGPPSTITAVTSAPVQQPVKSIPVMWPEPRTAVGPCHPGWLGAQAPEAAEAGPYAAGEAYAPGPRCPPPPYPKTLLLHGAPEPPEGKGPSGQAEEGSSGALAGDKAKTGRAEKSVKDKKQIQTSPVPVRKNARDEEKRESRIKSYSPFAFKFYMEQHVENVMKTYQQKLNRRMQLEQEMAKAGLSEAEQEQMRKMLYQKESNYNRLKRAKMDKSMFVKIKTLGIGAFGEVCLTRKVDTNALYAMKTLRKKDVLNRNQVAHVKAERDILAEADNEWVVRLYYSFQDRDNLYFVMDYIPGGDMMSLLIRLGVFPEPLARFYIAELTLAIESVHKMGFIHRDIKPDNILIDLDGHIKLTDFGLCTGFRWTHNSKYYQKGSHIRQDSMEPSDLWDELSGCRCGDRLLTLEQRAARQHQRCLAHSLVGTPNYIAPEVLLRKGYTQLCDWWSVGVILFEMLVGQPPFLAPTPTETQMKVINWTSTLQIPPQAKLSPEAADIIGRLCCAAEERLGGNGASEIKAHPFLEQMDFSSSLRTQPAPYLPRVRHPMDTSNFDPVEEGGAGARGDSAGSARAGDAPGSPHSKHPEHAFYEFTFRRFFDDNGCPFRYPKPADGLPGGAGAEEGCEPVYV
ncbi:serine/threonine-protein kinase LATS2 [Lepisosteus oculatus]|uniref:serine/threonine-protein kinase LATS2 n=1 Tax=Lepisosteus oculatus TaxID=7918 RepID=UPI0035F50B62